MNQGMNHEGMIACFLTGLYLAGFLIQARTTCPWHDFFHSGLAPHTPIKNPNNPFETYPQENLKKAITQMRLYS